MQRRPLSRWVQQIHVEVLNAKRGGLCPACESVRVCDETGRLPGGEYDHFFSRNRARAEETSDTAVAVGLKTACDGRGLVVEDPDWFAVMLVERKGSDPTPPKSNFIGMKFGYLVNGDAMAKGPFAALGLRAQARTGRSAISFCMILPFNTSPRSTRGCSQGGDS